MSLLDGQPATYTIGSSPYPSRNSCMTEVSIPGRSLSKFSFNASIPKIPDWVFVFGNASFIFRRMLRTLSSMMPILLLKSAATDLIYSRRRPASSTHATSEQIEFSPSLMVVSSLHLCGINSRFMAFGNGSVRSFSFSCVRLPLAFANSSGSVPFGKRMHFTFAPAFNSNSQFLSEALTPAASASYIITI